MIKINRGGLAVTLAAAMLAISLVAVPNLSTIEKSKINTDKRTAEMIGRATRIWQTDIDAGERVLPTSPVEYNQLVGLCPDYIGGDYTPKSLSNGKYYITSIDDGAYYPKICVYIGDEVPEQPLERPFIDYDGLSGWAFVEN